MRSIPAWAGETREIICRFHSGRVYPRVGGGNLCWMRAVIPAKGLSPRGRGKPIGTLAIHPKQGSIPAWAGETGRHLECR